MYLKTVKREKSLKKNSYKEGKATVYFDKEVFLNPHARLSRELSVAVVKAVGKKGMRLADPTAATGIRGIRYALETPVKDITLVDINRQAYLAARRNAKANGISCKIINDDIQHFCNVSKEHFDIIDLDPFGGVTPYVHDILRMCRDGTYFFATATDTAVLCGSKKSACIRLYDAVPMHNHLCHEGGIRILLGYIARHAAAYGFGIEPLLSVTYRTYMRVFTKLYHGSEKATAAIKNLGYAYYCQNCGLTRTSMTEFPDMLECPACGSRLIISGKMWLGRLFDENVRDKSLSNINDSGLDGENRRLISLMKEELDIPMYYHVPTITKMLGIGSVSPHEVVKWLHAHGFKASLTHIHDSSVKSDCTIEDMKRCITSISKSAMRR